MNIETLKQFCSTDWLYPMLAEPWSIGEWTYASNQQILLRVPRLEGVSELDKAVEINSSEFPFDEQCEWLDIPALPEPKMEKCTNCAGTGKECLICSACDGDGVFDCECPHCGDSHTARCKRCNGTGFESISDTPCATCPGTGNVENKHTQIAIGEAIYSVVLLRLLVNNLSGVKILPNGKYEKAAIMFDGGRGYIMPMRY